MAHTEHFDIAEETAHAQTVQELRLRYNGPIPAHMLPKSVRQQIAQVRANMAVERKLAEHAVSKARHYRAQWEDAEDDLTRLKAWQAYTRAVNELLRCRRSHSRCARMLSRWNPVQPYLEAAE